MKKITQAEARRLRRQVRELEERLRNMRSSYGREYPGIHVVSILTNDVTRAKLDTARKFGAVLIAKQSGNEVHIYGDRSAA